MKPLQIPDCLWGVGRVGRELLALIRQQDTAAGGNLAAVKFVVCGVADSRTAILVGGEAQLDELLKGKETTGRLGGTGVDFPAGEWPAWLVAAGPRILIDTSVSDFTTGQPALDLYRFALRAGRAVLTANKAPLIHGLKELLRSSSASGVPLRYGSTAGASLPAWDLLHLLSRESPISRLEVVLNGTTNWILTQMEEQGMEYTEALKQAQMKGYAEPDPRRDLEGLDTAAKLLILANSFREEAFRWQDVEVEGITRLKASDTAEAARSGYSIKLVGRLAGEGHAGWRLTVSPERLPREHPLSLLRGTQKGIWVETRAGGRYALLGGASGPGPTAAAMYRELLEITALLGDGGATR